MRLGWLINYKDRQAEIYRMGQEKDVVEMPVQLSGEDVLPEFILNLLWRSPLPTIKNLASISKGHQNRQQT